MNFLDFLISHIYNIKKQIWSKYMKKRQILFIIFLVLVLIPILFISNIELMLSYLRIIFLIVLSIALYMYMADIESKPPK